MKKEEEKQKIYRTSQETLKKNRFEKQHNDSWKLLNRFEIKQYLLFYLNGDKNRIRGVGNHLYHKRYDIYQYLEQEKLKFGYNSNSAILYMILNDMTEPPKCTRCNAKYCSFHFDSKTNKNRFSNYCRHCGFIMGGIKSNESFKLKHDGLGVFQIAEYREKGISKLLNVTGYKHPSQNPETMKKIIQKSIENNGGMGFASKNILKKINNSMNRNYGCDLWQYSSDSNRILKMKNKNIERIGVDSCMKLNSYRKLYHDMNLSSETIAKVKNYLNEYNLELVSEYYNAKTPLKVKCKKCGNQYTLSCFNQIQGGMLSPLCRMCNPEICSSISGPEIVIRKQLKELYPDINIETNVRNILENNKELDIYIPDKRLAIEYCGLWCHSSNISKKHQTIEPKSSTYHYNKYKQCKDMGIQLLTIFETESINSIIEKIRNTIDKNQFIDTTSLEKCSTTKNDYYLIDNRYNDYQFYCNKDEFELIGSIEPQAWFWESRDHDFIREDKFEECYCCNGEDSFAVANKYDYNWIYDCGYQMIKMK